MEEPPYPLIVVGCGKWGTNLINNAHALRHLVAIVDPSHSNISLLFDNFPQLKHIFTYAALPEALSNHQHAAVIVATPPNTHFTVARQALLVKRHVFVEKPLCVSISDAQTLTSMAAEARLTLMVDHLLQYSAPHQLLIHIVRTGFVGRVTRVRMSRLNFGTVRTAENVLWSFCPHDLSILLSLVAPLDGADADHALSTARVVATGQAVVSDDIHDYVDITIAFPGTVGPAQRGVQAQVEASWLHPLKERRIVVYGDAGAVILNEDMPDPSLPKMQGFKWTAKRTADGDAVATRKFDADLERHLRLHDEKDATGFTSDTQPLRAALNHFVHCIRTKKRPRTDGREALRVLSVLAAASESIRQNGEPVTVSQVVADSSIRNGISGQQQQQSPNNCGAANPGAAMETAHNTGCKVHPTAIIDPGAIIGPGTRIWHFSHVMPGAVLGTNCNIGQNVFIGSATTVGNNCKIQNNVSVYDKVTLGDNVFLGPSCVFTNVKTPRAHVSRRDALVETSLGCGVTVGANATIVCGVQLADYCFVGAGAVVTKNVPRHALVYGNPAQIRGWVSTTGVKLVQRYDCLDNAVQMACLESGEVYQLYENDDGSEPKIVRIDKET